MASEKTLVQILESYPTDKLANGYGEFYEELFRPIRYDVISLLEIGIFKGGSIRAWRDYFPAAAIHAIDIEKEFVAGLDGEERILGEIIDVSDRRLLESFALGRRFDVIIDDGSHKTQDIDTAFRVLWPCLTSSGLYITEDTTSVVMPAYESILMGTTTDIASVTLYPGMIVMKKK